MPDDFLHDRCNQRPTAKLKASATMDAWRQAEPLRCAAAQWPMGSARRGSGRSSGFQEGQRPSSGRRIDCPKC